MVTNKIRALRVASGPVLLVLLLLGCRPSGPRALLDGSRLLNKGQPAAAAVRLDEAVRAMPTNALAWAYLAVARHESGSLSEAASAYRKALQLKPDMVECRFGLGALHWQRGEWADAREQFAALTVLQPGHAPAWLRLGECQLRLADVPSARRSLSQAIALDETSAEAWNWLGLAQVQAGQWRDADASFERALEQQMNHAPALLNLAVVRQQRLNRPRDALDLYRQYLAFWPSAAHSDEVRAVAAQLEQQLVPPAPPPVVAPAAPSQPAPKLAAAKPATATPLPAASRPATPPPPADRSSLAPPVSVRPNPVPVSEPARSAPKPPTIAAPAVTNAPSAGSEPELVPAPRKRSLLDRLNPVNLFKGNPDGKTVTPLPGASSGPTEPALTLPPWEGAGETRDLPVPNAAGYPRYTYRANVSFVEGDQAEAKRLCREAERLRLGGRLDQAAERSRAAIRANPASYEAHFSLGLVALQAGDLPQALSGFEAATLIQPDSDAARYNLGLALKQGGYPVDAVGAMQRLLQQDPNDVRAHLMLGNLYDRPFGAKSLARRHYQRVLEISPNHPEAASIRFWLKENPP
jgi:tetratricopeptide (TPR) repeat protein